MSNEDRRAPEGSLLAADFFTLVLEDLWSQNPYYVAANIRLVEGQDDCQEGDLDLIFRSLHEHAQWPDWHRARIKKVVENAREWWKQNGAKYEAVAASIEPIPPSGS